MLPPGERGDPRPRGRVMAKFVSVFGTFFAHTPMVALGALQEGYLCDSSAAAL